MADQTNAEVSDERLREIIAGCEGVTPGPWSDGNEAIFINASGQDKPWNGTVLIGDPKENLLLALTFATEAELSAQVARHIGRLDPDTIKAIATELLNRRSVTSQASEGEVVDAGPISEHESTDEAMWRAAVLKDRGYYFLAASERLEQEAYDRAAARGEHTGTDGI